MATSQPTNEQWKPVPGYEGSYEVSDQGRVRSLDRLVPGKDGRVTRFHGRVLKPWENQVGHKYVQLGRKDKRIVHRLVLETFVGPCPEGMEACHWNDVPGDNRLENLRWDTRRANSLDRQRNGIDYQLNKTHCKWGHEFSPENTFISKRGSRVCRACRLQKKREENARNRLLRAS